MQLYAGNLIAVMFGQWGVSTMIAQSCLVLIGLLPILKPGAFTNNNVEWQRYRRMDLYHRCMDYVVDEINQLCSEDKHFRFADGKFRLGPLGRCF